MGADENVWHTCYSPDKQPVVAPVLNPYRASPDPLPPILPVFTLTLIVRSLKSLSKFGMTVVESCSG
jgi:hypothetical protein